jgi:hypothetical protein
MPGVPVTSNPISNDGYRLVEDQSDYEIILGHRYSTFYSTTISGSIGTNILAITTNSIKICEAWFSIEVDKAGLYELYEGAVISSGSVLTLFNNNRNSSNVADCTVVGNPNVSTVGTFIGAHVIGSATGGTSKSGGSSTTNKYQLKYNTTYILRFTADVSSTRVTQGIYWREI